MGDGVFPCSWHFICQLCSVLSGWWGRATCLGHTEPASLRGGGKAVPARGDPGPALLEKARPSPLLPTQGGLTFCLTFMFRVKETAKLPISEDSFRPPRRGVGNQGQSSRHPPPCRASAPGYTSPPPAPAVCGRQTVQGNGPSFLHTPPSRPQPPFHLPAPPPFCKYVKRKKCKCWRLGWSASLQL